MKTLIQWSAAALLAGVSCAASAQAQSPENAHAFFQTVAKTQAVIATDFTASEPRPLRITSLESSGCISRIAFEEGGQLLALHMVDWREVRSTRVEEERVPRLFDSQVNHVLRLRGPQVDYQFSFETAEIAKRVGYAMNIVRRSCDPVAGFGF